jgi:hypothetical protein
MRVALNGLFKEIEEWSRAEQSYINDLDVMAHQAIRKLNLPSWIVAATVILARS